MDEIKRRTEKSSVRRFISPNRFVKLALFDAARFLRLLIKLVHRKTRFDDRVFTVVVPILDIRQRNHRSVGKKRDSGVTAVRTAEGMEKFDSVFPWASFLRAYPIIGIYLIA